MAEFLEDLGSEDSDRKIDCGDFKASQFEIFTHEYREKAPPTCHADNATDHTACEQFQQKSNQTKKELVNITRKLQRALASLQLVEGSDSISGMLGEMETVNSQLHEIIIKINSEFGQTTIPLPDYDPTDMKCFLGDDEVKDQKSMIELVHEEMLANKSQLDAVIFKAEILLCEYDHMKHGIKESCKNA